MTSNAILALYLVFFGVEFLFAHLLIRLNIGSLNRNSGAVPEIFSRFIDKDRYSKSVSYCLTRNYFAIVTSAISAAVLLTVVLTGFLGTIDSWFAYISISVSLQGLLYVGAVSLFFRLISLPTLLYSQFVIEERFGFNKMTVKTFVLDTLKSTALSIVIGVPVLLALFWFVRSAGPLWWLYAFAAISAFQFVISLLYPKLIAPLFNKFTPLTEGTLRTNIEELARNLSFGARGIFVMDGSKRSRHSNAYFTGFGKTKRIVLFDTLLQQLSEDQILVVLAHEIGHQKKRHLLQRMAVSFLLTAAIFKIIDVLLGTDSLFFAFGFERTSVHGLLIILSFCAGPFTFLFTPLFTMWSRHHEYQADRFAADKTGKASDMIEALMALGRDNLSNFTPHPLYSFFNYSHPSLAERITSLANLESSQKI